MNDLVSRQAVLDALAKVHWFEVSSDFSSPIGGGFENISALHVYFNVNAVRKAIESVPTVASLGRWIIHGEPPMYVKECSLCGSRFFHHAIETLTPYCACCGGRMEGKTDADEG